MISFRHLHYFTAAAQSGSATRAARLLNVSQPSISAAIRELEAQFGQKLFERRQARGLELTGFGAEKLAEARAILSRLDGFSSGTSPAPRLSLAYFATLGSSLVPPLLARLTRDIPDLRVDLRESDLKALSRALENGTVDLAITYDVGLSGDIARQVLGELKPHAVMSPDHPLATQADVSLAELAAYPFILIDLPLSREFLMVPFWQQGLSPKVVLRTGSVEMVRSMAANGLGVSMLFTRPHHDLADDGTRVACLPIRDDTPRQQLVVACSAHASPTTQAALAVISAHFLAPDQAGKQQPSGSWITSSTQE